MVLLMAAPPLRSILAEFNRLEGVRGSAVISRDGFPIEVMFGAVGIDPEALSAMIVTLYGSAHQIGSELKLGDIDIIVVEFANYYLLIQDLGEALFTVIADRRALLGRIRFEMKRQRDRIKAAL